MWRRVVIGVLTVAILLGASCLQAGSPVIPPTAIAGDNSGGAIVVYEIQRMSDSYVQFYAQKISPEGDFLWGEKGTLIDSGYAEGGSFASYTIIVSDGSGGAIVIWIEFLPQAEGELTPSFQTYVAKIDSEGNVQWRREIPGVDPGVDQAVLDGLGGVIIAYRAPYEENISVLKIDAEGNLPWGEDGVSLNLFGYDSCRDIASDNSGGIIVVQQIPGEDIISAQRVNSEANILWEAGGVQVCAGPAEGAQVVNDGAGGAIIAYMRDIPCEDGKYGYCDSDIYAQRIDAEGNILWGSDGMPICIGPSTPNSPKVVTDGAGGAVILFVFLGDYAAIHAQRIDADGHKLWNEDVELWKSDYGLSVHPVVSDGSGGAISLWYYGARAQRLDAAGRKLWGPDGTPLTPREMYLPMAVQDGCGGVLISWSAIKFGRYEASYYVQRIDGEGNLPWGGDGILLNP